MRRRYKITMALGVVACMAVAFAAIGLSGSLMTKPVPDLVTTSVPETVTGGDMIYYATGTGNYYHTDPSCSGMEGALPMTAEAVLALGKQACPVCCEEAMKLCWATEQGVYYHHDRECYGMQGAVFCTVAQARARGQKPCPMCMDTDSIIRISD